MESKKIEELAPEQIFENHLNKYGWHQMAKECKNDALKALDEFTNSTYTKTK